MKRIIDYFVKNYGFTTYKVGSNVHTLIKDDIHIFLYTKTNKVVFNNIIFENIKSIVDLKFIYFKCKGIKEDDIINTTKKLIIERDMDENNILKYK